MRSCYCKANQSNKVEELAEYLKIIADSNRLQILCLLKDGERCVCDILKSLSLPQNLVSHHLKVLRDAGLVNKRKDGRWAHYSLNESKISSLNALYDKTFRKGALKVLFLCTGNSSRSQIAEGLTNALLDGRIEAHSAGIEAQGVNPFAAQVMAEIGIDISKQHSKTIDKLAGISFDYVITLCDNAKSTCPVFPTAVKTLHQGFEDPALIKKGSKELKLKTFRRVRDEIKDFITELPKIIKELNENNCV